MEEVPTIIIVSFLGLILGAIGVSGDTSENDEIVGVAGIEGAGLTTD